MKILKSLGNTAEEEIKGLENKFRFQFPNEYREHLLKYNGGYPDKSYFKGSCVDYFLEFEKESSLDFYYVFRVFKDKEDPRMPRNIIPIASDPFGNFICISVEGEDLGFIYFWRHEEEVEDGEIPDYRNMSLKAKSFNEFMNNLREE